MNVQKKKTKHSQSCSKQDVQKYGLLSLHVRGLKGTYKAAADERKTNSSSCALMIGQRVIGFNPTKRTLGWLPWEISDVINFVLGNLVQESVKPPPQEGLINS